MLSRTWISSVIRGKFINIHSATFSFNWSLLSSSHNNRTQQFIIIVWYLIQKPRKRARLSLSKLDHKQSLFHLVYCTWRKRKVRTNVVQNRGLRSVWKEVLLPEPKGLNYALLSQCKKYDCLMLGILTMHCQHLRQVWRLAGMGATAELEASFEEALIFEWLGGLMYGS